MKTDKNDTPEVKKSRRTGLDRRWIHTPNYQPERRSGVDRRNLDKGSIPESLEENRQEKATATFPRLDSGA